MKIFFSVVFLTSVAQLLCAQRIQIDIARNQFIASISNYFQNDRLQSIELQFHHPLHAETFGVEAQARQIEIQQNQYHPQFIRVNPQVRHHLMTLLADHYQISLPSLEPDR